MFARIQPVTDLAPQVLAAMIAAGVAAFAAVATLVGTLYSQHRTRSQLDRHRSEDRVALQRTRLSGFYRKQLDELYGEMLILRHTSKSHWDRLRGEQDPFRLIDEIETIWNEPSEKRRRIVHQILAINERLATLIESKSSLLIDLPPPDSFLQFLDHQRALADLWQMKTNADGSEPSFPRDFDADIETAIARIRESLKAVESADPVE